METNRLYGPGEQGYSNDTQSGEHINEVDPNHDHEYLDDTTQQRIAKYTPSFRKIGAVLALATIGTTLAVSLITRDASAGTYSQPYIESQQISGSFYQTPQELEKEYITTNTQGIVIEQALEDLSTIEESTTVSEVQSDQDTNTGLEKEQSDWWEYPDEIFETIRSGDDLLVLVNKEYQLPEGYEPQDLVLVTSAGIPVRVGNENAQIREIVINDLRSLNEAAKAEGITLVVRSAYRSFSEQDFTYHYWNDFHNGDLEKTDQSSARPGHSQHQLGTALDFTSPEIGNRLGAEFDNTEAAEWLTENAWKYGFILSYEEGDEHTNGFMHESWHYRYIGIENAKEWKESGLSLEEFLRSKNGL